MASEETAPAVRQPAAAPRRGAQADWLERMFAEWPWSRPRLVPAVWPAFEGADVLRTEEIVDDKQVLVRAELPGIDPDKDVEITVSDHTLRITAERRETTTSDEKGTYRSEFRYGRFAREVPLPAGASEEGVKATYKDGILEVRVPLDTARAEARKVRVKRG
jgi:HSP20 family protein